MNSALLLLICLTPIVCSKKISGFHECVTDAYCQAIAPKEEVGIKAGCRSAEMGNEASPRLCIYANITMDNDERATQLIMNPNEKRCRLVDVKRAKDCVTFVRVHNACAGKGKIYGNCVTGMSPYFCKIRAQTSLVCSVVLSKCGSPSEAT